MADIKSLLGAGSTLLIIESEDYADTVTEIVAELSRQGKVGYISLNKLITPLRRSFEKKNIDLKKIYFVDCITKSVIASPEVYPNCLYVPSPNDLTKMSITITKMLKAFEPGYLVFDSVSTLLIYESTDVTSQFLHSLVNKISAYGTKSVLTCLQGQKEENVIKNLSLIVDRIEKI